MSERDPEYSREAYEAAQAEAEEARAKISFSEKSFEQIEEVAKKEAAKERLVELHGAAWDEALVAHKLLEELFSQKEALEGRIAEIKKKGINLKHEKKETEKQPTLEEQAAVYAEMFGGDQEEILEAARVLQAEMSEQERRELTLLVWVPKGETTAKAWERVKRENLTNKWDDPTGIETKSETENGLVAFGRFSQEADRDSLGSNAKSAQDWEKTNQKLMSPKMAMIAREAFRRLTGKQMDEKYWTLFPGSRFEGDGAVSLSFGPVSRKVYLDIFTPGARSPLLGVRRVVSKELEA